MRHYRLMDYLTQGYLAVVGVLILLFHGESIPDWTVLAATHLGAIVLVHGVVLVSATRRGRGWQLLRTFYPLVLYTPLYTWTHHVDDMFFAVPFDGLVIDWDQSLFGEQLCRTAMQRFPSPLISELLYLAYFSYYAMVVGVGVAVYLWDRTRVFRYVTTISFVFYICYLTYVLFPVMGPHATTRTGVTFVGALAEVGPRVVPPEIAAGPFYGVMALVYELVEPAGGAAFPSSHVAIAVTTLCFTWGRWPRFRWVHVVATVLLCVSTVYCGYHYAVDVLGGLAAAAILVPVASRLYRRCDGARPDDRQPPFVPEGRIPARVRPPRTTTSG